MHFTSKFCEPHPYYHLATADRFIAGLILTIGNYCNHRSKFKSMVLFLLTEVCKPGYCANGGICKSVGNKPTCICQPGFTGPQCQTKIGTYCFLKFIVSLITSFERQKNLGPPRLRVERIYPWLIINCNTRAHFASLAVVQ